MTTQYILGIDGGGPKTVCVALDKTSKILGHGQAGSTNRHRVGDANARANLEKAITATLAAIPCSPHEIATVSIGLTGVDRPPERNLLASWLNAILPGTPGIIHNDATIALASGTGGDLFGVVAISSTAMIVYGVNQSGQTKRLGGWGPHLGDKGSGYAIAAGALKAIANAVDGLGPATALEGALLDYLDLSSPQALLAWAYRDFTWARIADLAPLVIECARERDPVALAIVEEAAIDLAAMVEAVVRELQLLHTPIPLVLAGGNLQPGFFANLVCQHFHCLIPEAQIRRPVFELAVGAALLGLRQQEGGVS